MHLNLLLAAFGLLAVFCLFLLALLAFWLHRFSKQSQAGNNQGVALLQQQVESLRSQVAESLARTSDGVNRQLGTAVGQLQQQMGQVLTSLQATTGQINTRLDDASRVVQNVSHQLGSLSQATDKIFEATKNISTLEEILKPPKLRGTMGEILLENVLREILPAGDFFALQYGFKTGETVDAVIRLKDGLIPIDAKFMLDNFRRMIECKDAREQAQLRKDFVRDVKKHIDDIARKYILQDEGTFNFALMYIPAENIYYETIIRQENGADDLYAYATRKHVFPVSPNSLYPYLMTLSLGLRGLQIERRAQDILGELSRVHGDLERFTKDFRTAGEHLTNAGKKFADAEKKLDRLDQKLGLLKEGSEVPAGEPKLLEPGDAA